MGEEKTTGFCKHCSNVTNVPNTPTIIERMSKIRKKHGRVRTVHWGSRTLDVDILLYGSLKINSKQLKLPHPRLHLRDFVFVPLIEIAAKPIQLQGKLLAELIQKGDSCVTIKDSRKKKL